MANEIQQKEGTETKDEMKEDGADRRTLATETETMEEVASETKSHGRKYLTKHMKLYPELYRSDVSIHPSYTTLKNLPYYVVCRRRIQRTKKQIKRQLNREIVHFANMQMFAIDSVRIDRVFSLGMPPKTLIVPDFLTREQKLTMFRNKYQHGFLSILYSCGSSPLELWDMHVKNGYIRRVTDEEVKSLALEISGTNVTTTYIFCPRGPQKTLGIKLPFLIMTIKNMKKYFTFEITILDDKDMHRRFRMSNFQSTTRVRHFCTSMPIGLSGGWNQIQFNLADFTRRAYGTNYVETTRIQIHANCRIRRIYFADRLYSEDELPEDFKLFLPMHRKKCVREADVKKVEEKKKPEESEPEEPPPFEAHEEGEEEEEEEEAEEAEEEPLEELAEEEAEEEVQRKSELREEDEEEEEDEIEPPEIRGYDAEDEGDDIEEPGAVPVATPGYTTEEETDAEQGQGDEDEEYEVQ